MPDQEPTGNQQFTEGDNPTVSPFGEQNLNEPSSNVQSAESNPTGQDDEPATLSQETVKKPWYKTTVAKVGAVVLVTSAAAATVAGLVLPKADGNFTDPNGDKTPGIESPTFVSPEDPSYDPFAEIGDKSNLAIGDLDRLASYFTSPEVSRDALIKALSQASQEEVDRIFEVMGDYDSTNNDEVTQILNKYGLVTSEVPVDQMGRISEKNDFTEKELDVVAVERYPDIAYNDIKNALVEFSQEEIDTTRGVLNGESSIVVLNNLLRDHGVVLGDGYLS